VTQNMVNLSFVVLCILLRHWSDRWTDEKTGRAQSVMWLPRGRNKYLNYRIYYSCFNRPGGEIF